MASKVPGISHEQDLTTKLLQKYPYALSHFQNSNPSLELILDTLVSYYEKIIACMPEVVYWTDRNCKAIGCNENQLKVLGLNSITEFQGLTFEEAGIKGNWSTEATHKFKSDTMEVLRTGKAKLNVEEPPITDKNGLTTYYLTSRVPVFDVNHHVVAVVGISTDITERKKAEEELKAAKEKSENILSDLVNRLAGKYPYILSNFNQNATSVEVMLDAVFEYYGNIIACMPGNVYWTDNKCICIGCNDNQLKLFGLSSVSEFKGLTFEELGIRNKFSSEIIQKLKSDTIEVITTGKAKLNVEEPPVPDKNGNPVYYLTSRVPLFDSNHTVVAVVGISIDITAQKKAEEELRIAKEKAEQANELKTKFIQNMQHDVRTPLAGVYQYMEIWAREETDPEKKHCAELMRASTGQLLNMCNELVDFENIEYLGDTVHLEPVETAKFLSKVIDLNRMAAHSRDLEIKLLVEPNVPPRLKLDKKKLYRVLVNLIGNSLKFTDEGSVTLHIKALSLSLTSATISFEIHDTGVGIPEDKIDLIFDKFVRLNPSNQAKYKGSGLGLYYVKKFVDDMQGKLDVESAEGHGSIFRVILTLAIPSADEVVKEVPHEIDTFQDSVAKEIQKLPDERFLKKASAKDVTSIDSHTTAPLTSSPKILLIEDDPIQQKMISKTIKDIGGQIAKIVDSVSLSCTAINEWKYDLVISDLGITGGSGIDVINWAKENKTHPNQQTPFIALTANVDDDMKQTALNSGFNNIYVKPLTRKVAENIFTKYVVTQNDDLKLSQDKDVIDIDASLEIGTDIEILKELFSMLTESIVEDKKQLQMLFEKNDVESTRKLLHRLDGTFRYCTVPMLQQTRTALHDAIRDTQTLDKVTKLYDAFYKEIDNYLATYEKFKKDGKL